jgi:hypothetical protein
VDTVACIFYTVSKSDIQTEPNILHTMANECDWLSFIVLHVGHENDSSGYTYDFQIENCLPRISSYGCICHHYLQDRNEVL